MYFCVIGCVSKESSNFIISVIKCFSLNDYQYSPVNGMKFVTKCTPIDYNYMVNSYKVNVYFCIFPIDVIK